MFVLPRALEAIAHLHEIGLPVVLSDGDVVFQPRKIRRSGIWDAVEGRVLIHLHKERTLAAMKLVLGDRLTTVFVRQGHYAVDAANTTINPPPDRVIGRIGDLCDHGLDWF